MSLILVSYAYHRVNTDIFPKKFLMLGLAENKDRYRIYGDDSTQTMYLYFKDEDEIPVTGVTDKDYSKWYKMKQPEKRVMKRMYQES